MSKSKIFLKNKISQHKEIFNKKGISSYFKFVLLENYSENQTIFKNTFWLFLSNAVSKIGSFFISVMLARHLGVSDYGQFIFVVTFTGLFSFFSDFGLNTLTTRDISRNPSIAKKYISNIMTLKIGLALFSWFLSILTIYFISEDIQVIKVVCFYGIYSILSTFIEFTRAIFRAFEHMQYEAYSKLLEIIILVVLLIFITLFQYSTIYIAFIYALVGFINLLFSLILVKKKIVNFEIMFDYDFIKNVILRSIPFGISLIFVSIYFSIDSIIISRYLGNKALGLYSTPYMLVTALYIIPSILCQSYFSKLSFYFISSFERFIVLLNKLLRYLTLIVIPLSIILYFSAKYLIIKIYGVPYENSVIIFKILILALIAKFYSFAYGTILSVTNMQKSRVHSQGIIAVINLATNLLFIPVFGIVAAAITTVLSEVLLAILYYKGSNHLLYDHKKH